MTRREMERRAWIAAALSAGTYAALGLRTRHARGQATVACVNCSTVFQQLLEYAGQLRGLATQARQYALQAQQYANMVQNTVSMPSWVWRSIQGDVMAVQGIIRSGSQISMNSGMAVSSLGNYAGYVAQGINMPGKYEAWSQQANANIVSLGRAFGLMQDQSTGQMVAYRQAQGAVMTSRGMVQATQAHAQVTAQAVDELMLLRQQHTAMAQFALNEAQMRQDERLVAQANLDRFMTAEALPMSGGRRY